MTDYTASRMGSANAAGDVTALYLKTFGGEVMTAFEQGTVFLSRHFNQSIQGAKSKQFPIIGRASAAYHTVGAEITGTQIAHNERVITIDDMLQSNTFVADWDEMVNHYEVRSKYSDELGRVLAQVYDRTIAQCGVLAARASSPITGENGGSVLTDANYATSGAALAAACFDARQIWDESDITGNPSFFVRPAQYMLMAETTSILNKDWGGSGAYSKGSVGTIADIMPVKTNNLPSTNVNTGPSKYQGNFSTTVGLFMTEMAVGSLTLKSVSVKSDYQLQRLGTLMVATLAFGAGVLRPICAIEAKTS